MEYSQLLEVLLEFNDNPHVEPNLRFGLNAPEDATSLPTPERDLPPNDDSALATTALQNAKSDMAAGRINTEDYPSLEDAVKQGRAFAATNDYPSLLKVPHTAPQSNEQRQSAEGRLEDSLGFLTPEHETEYYLALDSRLGDEAAAQQLNRAPERPLALERDREAALRNPVSVYNWLRRNQPHIFFHDNENASEKSSTRPARSSKKTQARKEEEHDEDTASVDTGPTSNPKTKRKRDEDSGYRPKGGSNRSRKKKDDGTSSSRRTSKKASNTGA